MALTFWTLGFSGNWTNGLLWTAGVPTTTIGMTFTGLDALIEASGLYTVTLSTAAIADSLDVDSAGAIFNETATGSLATNGGFELDAGTAILLGANASIGAVSQRGGLLEINSAAAMGTGTYTFGGGELLAVADTTVVNQLAVSGDVTFAAAHGATLTLDNDLGSGSFFSSTTPGKLIFGQGNNDGTVVWENDYLSQGPAPYTVTIAAGTVKIGASDNIFGDVTHSTTIDAGATLDLDGAEAEVSGLRGAGLVDDAGAGPATMDFAVNTNFGGTIQGDISVEVGSQTKVILSGTDTYTGTTTIESSGSFTKFTVLQIGDGGLGGSITSDIDDEEAELVFDRSGAFTQNSGITGQGTGAGGTYAVTYEGGARVTIDRGENYEGGTLLDRGEVVLGNSAGLGVDGVMDEGGEVLATVNITLAASAAAGEDAWSFSLIGAAKIAAAHGKTLTLDSSSLASSELNLDSTSTSSATLDIGDGVNDGTVILKSGGNMVYDGNLKVVVRSGGLELGDALVGTSTLGGAMAPLLDDIASTTIDAGAELDGNGFALGLTTLLGGGRVIDDGAAISVNLGDFSGVISGSASLEVSQSLILSGQNTYAGGTTIDGAGLGSAGALELGDGGATGSIVGPIVDDGVLAINHSNRFVETGAISGTGKVFQLGLGTTVLDQAESYSGGTTILAGALSINVASAIGLGALTMQGGEFLATANIKVTQNDMKVGGDSDLAAAAGKTLNLNDDMFFDTGGAATTLAFGDSADKGTILWNVGGADANATGVDYVVDVRDGILKIGAAGATSLINVLTHDHSATVEAGAAIDLAGLATTIDTLEGAGAIDNSGAATSLTLNNADFGGAINGATHVLAEGATTLSGGGTFSGGVEISIASTLTLAGTGTTAVVFDSTGKLDVDNGVGVARTVDITTSSTGGDLVTGGAGDDTFKVIGHFANGDSLSGGTGADVFIFSAADFTSAANVRGGSGAAIDTLKFSSAGTIAAGAFANTSAVEAIALANGTNSVTLSNALVGSAHGASLSVVGGSGDDTIDASAVTTATDKVRMTGGGGADSLIAGGASDTFVYSAASQSTGVGYDTVSDANFAHDVFDVPGAKGTIKAIDGRVKTGALSTATFNHDLAAAIGKTELGAHDAVLFKASTGSLAGQTFLVVDLNGTAGYQAGADLVIRLTGAVGTLTTANFV